MSPSTNNKHCAFVLRLHFSRRLTQPPHLETGCCSSGKRHLAGVVDCYTSPQLQHQTARRPPCLRQYPESNIHCSSGRIIIGSRYVGRFLCPHAASRHCCWARNLPPACRLVAAAARTAASIAWACVPRNNESTISSRPTHRPLQPSTPARRTRADSGCAHVAGDSLARPMRA